MESTSTDLAAPIIRALRERRTVSQSSLSQTEEPDHALVLDAIASARWAPNHHLTEPWRFYLLDPARIRRLGELWAEVLERGGSSPAKVAAKRREWGGSKGVVVLLCQSPQADEKTRREDYAACCCAAQNFMLHLWACGLGSKWSTAEVDEHEAFWPLLGHDERPEGTEVVGVFFYGVPERIPEGRRSKGIEEITVNFRA
jgi:nitroreductase